MGCKLFPTEGWERQVLLWACRFTQAVWGRCTTGNFHTGSCLSQTKKRAHCHTHFTRILMFMGVLLSSVQTTVAQSCHILHTLPLFSESGLYNTGFQWSQEMEEALLELVKTQTQKDNQPLFLIVTAQNSVLTKLILSYFKNSLNTI